MSQQPNILVIMTDQQRADWLGCYGHPVLQTPNIDAIAANGTRFNEFYTASPVCMPNRASLMTGRYPSVHGLRYNGCHLPTDSVTFVDVLAQAGYHTAGIGKSHLQPFTGIAAESRVDRDELGYFDEARFGGRTPHPQPPLPEGEGASRANLVKPLSLGERGWGEGASGTSYPEETAHLAKGVDKPDFPLPYYGFQHIDMLTAHGFKSGGHYIQWLLEQEPDGLALLNPANQLDHVYSCPQAIRLALPEELYTTSYVKRKALDYLDAQQGKDEPFFAFVSFNDPHHPFNPPGKYWDMYDPAEFTVSPGYDQLVNPIPPLQRVREQHLNGVKPKTMETVFMASEREAQEAMALTAGMITMIDDAVGEIVAKLKATGQYENTVIVFTSDHGDFLGDHSLMLKGALPYRGITRVPFIWSDPVDRTPRTCDALSSTLDIAPSLIERAGLKPYWGIQGKDINAQARGCPDEVRDQLLIEYEDGMARFGFDEPALGRTLLTGEYRLTIYKGQDFGELYDLRNDPLEQHNRFDDAGFAELRAELMGRLVQEMMMNMETSPRAVRRA